jgi:hypothetical protein
VEVRATDGDVGGVLDVFFDDRGWAVTHVVVDAERWAPHGERVLVPMPYVQGTPDGPLEVGLTRRQIEHGRRAERVAHAGHEHRRDLISLYGDETIAAGAATRAPMITPQPPESLPAREILPRDDVFEEETDPHLVSVRDVVGYHVGASDGDIGHVKDMVVGGDWILRYAIVETGHWQRGHAVVIGVEWIESIDWRERRVHVSVTRDAVRHAPGYDPSRPFDRAYEEALHDHHGKDAYWARRAADPPGG